MNLHFLIGRANSISGGKPQLIMIQKLYNILYILYRYYIIIYLIKTSEIMKGCVLYEPYRIRKMP